MEEKKNIKKFEDLEVWQLGIEISVELIKEFSYSKFYSLKDQMLRSAISIPSNIAEGFERNSNREFSRFLKISKASCGELKTQLFIVLKGNVLGKEKVELLIEKAEMISAKIGNLIKSVENRIRVTS